jgi:L,D-peptidoglycan transpeptidase YkuD (ErfK/YbiS/YcfS/YnhG family)
MTLAVHVVAAALAAACPSYPSVPPATAQLLTVSAPRLRTTAATFRAWRRDGDCWRQVAGPFTARVGWNGLRVNRREGDGTTPIGTFPIAAHMYGNEPNPGVAFRYTRLHCGDWWVEDPRSPSYNRFRHVACGATPPFRTTSEDMSKSPTAYRHLAVIDYNTHPIVPGRGSGIFLHVSHGNPTLGCVSLPLPQLVKLLRWFDPAKRPLIVIGTRSTIRKF